MPLAIHIDAAAARALAFGVVVIEDVVPRPAEERDRLIESALARVLAEIERAPAGEKAFIEPARRIYKRFGLDPTKHRPSSEALLRRLRRGDPFPRVNPLVDAVNLCQLEERLPYGLYDLDLIHPPVTARVGLPGESYEGIRKGPISLAGRPALFDVRGPFGNPSSDSDRTKTTAATRRALVVTFGLPETPEADWARSLERTAATLLGHVAGRVTESRTVRGETGETGAVFSPPHSC
jgi:DNA/RNA-binding domain of Phe-tRNA-synthetase-like protein